MDGIKSYEKLLYIAKNVLVWYEIMLYNTRKCNSNPGVTSRKNLVTAMVTRFFYACFELFTPLFTPYRILYPILGAGNALDKCLHAVGAVPLHLIGDMAINVQGKGCGGVSQVALHGLDIAPGADSSHGVTVP